MSRSRWAVAAVVAAGAVATSSRWSSLVPEPYMDEEFHVRQTRTFCRGNWHTWDAKITTPPGLYVGAIAMLQPVAWGLQVPLESLCNVANLRLSNTAYLVGLFAVLCGLADRQLGPTRRTAATAVALGIALFPLVSFFAFMYYTDVGGAFWVLWGWLLAMQRRPWASGAAGLVSLTFRQTNVVWVAATALWRVVDALSDSKDPHTRGRLRNLTVKAASRASVVALVQNAAAAALVHAPYLATRVVPMHIVAGLLSIVFVRWNGGIVLGDRANHIAGMHAMQPLYYAAFSALLLAPVVCADGGLLAMGKMLRRPSGLFWFCVATVAAVAVVHWGSRVHPFVLADNRHYVFYLWRRVLGVSPWRYALAPGYAAAFYLLGRRLLAAQPLLHVVLYVFAVCAAIIPSPLIEFRYFILPFLYLCVFLVPQVRAVPRGVLLAQLALFIAVGFLTVHVFLYHARSGGLLRFMW